MRRAARLALLAVVLTVVAGETLPVDETGLYPVKPAQFTSTDDLLDAAKRSDVEALNVALKAGARVDNADVSGLTSMHYACRRRNLAMFSALMKAHFTNFDAKDENGITALALAADHGFLEGATGLINAGADPNIVDRWKLTALMRAARGSDTVNRLLLVQRLMNAGAKHLLYDHQGDTALEIAENQGNAQIASFLRKLNDDGHVRIGTKHMTESEKAIAEARARADAAFGIDTDELLRKEAESVRNIETEKAMKAGEHEDRVARNLVDRRNLEAAQARGEL